MVCDCPLNTSTITNDGKLPFKGVFQQTNDEKRSWLGGKPVVVSAALELAVAARASVPVSEGGAELGGLFGRGVGAVISPARAAPGQSYHSQSPRQDGLYEQAAVSVIPFSLRSRYCC